jgi:hypothetical protein
MAKVLDDHIKITPGIAGGKPRIAGRRITVQNIAILHERMGRSADEIDGSIRDGEAFAEALRESRVAEWIKLYTDERVLKMGGLW